MRASQTSLWIAIVVALATSCRSAERQGKAEIKSMEPGIGQILANPHGGGMGALAINGTRYKDVLGLYPYYLEISELHSIVFVTRTGPGKGQLHLYDLRAKSDASFPPSADMFGFGMRIGSDPVSHPSFYSTAKSDGTNRIRLREHQGQSDNQYVIDVPLRSITAVPSKTK
jgi:hypothetical protein